MPGRDDAGRPDVTPRELPAALRSGRRLALHAAEAVPLHQLVERAAVLARQPCGERDVAAGAGEQPAEIMPLEDRDGPGLGRLEGLVEIDLRPGFRRDEVEAMSPRAQGVLLRFLQDHSYRPVGGQRLARGDLRIVASSNVDLQALTVRGQFRQDLLFRLGVLSVTMPPLRRRGDDARLLAEHFVRRFARQHGRPEKRLHPDSLAWMARHAWPGNVRELENLMLRELLLGDGETIRLGEPEPAAAEVEADLDLDQAFQPAKARAISAFERLYITRLLARTGGNISMAARLSRKDRSALNKLVKKHGLGGGTRETAAGA